MRFVFIKSKFAVIAVSRMVALFPSSLLVLVPSVAFSTQPQAKGLYDMQSLVEAARIELALGTFTAPSAQKNF